MPYNRLPGAHEDNSTLGFPEMRYVTPFSLYKR
jgi:hypothetical protein